MPSVKKSRKSHRAKKTSKDDLFTQPDSPFLAIPQENVPPPLSPSQTDQNELPQKVSVCEENENNLNANDQEEQTSGSVVTSVEDEVTIDPTSETPHFFCYDPQTNKLVFQISKYDYDAGIYNSSLNDKKAVKNMSWKDFCNENSILIKSYFQPLSFYYKSGFSSKFARDFCAVLTSKLPFSEKQFHRFKKKSAKGKLTPDMSKTAKSFASYSDFLYSRFHINSRYHVLKAAKERNEPLKVKKKNGAAVTLRNKMRKRSSPDPN